MIMLHILLNESEKKHNNINMQDIYKVIKSISNIEQHRESYIYTHI